MLTSRAKRGLVKGGRCAISTRLAAGQGAVTLDLKLTYLRPLSVRSGTISAEGKVVKLGRQTSYAEGLAGTGQAILRCTRRRPFR